MKEQNHDYYHFFPPVEGIVTQSFDEKKRHYGTDIVAKANAKVAAVLDGVVIFTDWTVKTGYVTRCNIPTTDFCIQTQFYPIEKTGRLCQGRRGPGGSGKYRRGVQRPPFAF